MIVFVNVLNDVRILLRNDDFEWIVWNRFFQCRVLRVVLLWWYFVWLTIKNCKVARSNPVATTYLPTYWRKGLRLQMKKKPFPMIVWIKVYTYLWWPICFLTYILPFIHVLCTFWCVCILHVLWCLFLGI